MDTNHRIKINVSGTRYEIEEDILRMIPLFNGMLECEHSNQEIYVPRSPILFDHVYRLAVDEKYKYPAKYTSELDYYGVKVKGLKRRVDGSVILEGIVMLIYSIFTIACLVPGVRPIIEFFMATLLKYVSESGIDGKGIESNLMTAVNEMKESEEKAKKAA